ncbi:mannose-1-phosphate guanylyltransferase [Thermoactinomyces daqus]|uniref:Mannose-1-phosphate guanylyltransferase n=1 Tax=Thermoactinomyces daqus TaxID=1329516 RepID=A0A7W1XDE7_9BACL|nr:sugar phosphate nucleotidyltransferase [Thermoactinomyces daqus]MBA4544571.1 mannose-1-phosphate guanylyltransferase [Thermoactinomyces daqus]
MKLVLLSGGSGKRLWPLSNGRQAKQFLKLLSDENGHLHSMLQRIWRQLSKANLTDSTIITAGKMQVDLVRDQLGFNVNCLIEPSCRDTFPSIALSTAYLYSCQEGDRNEVIVVLPVDSYVEDKFYEELKKIDRVINTSGADIALVGVNPSHLSTKYGYIVPEKEQTKNNYLRVLGFEEKPTPLRASELINVGALWNSGVFAFKTGYILDILEQMDLPTEYEDLNRKYRKLPNISFDYQVVEKARNIVVVKYEGFWKDLGTWDDLTEEINPNIMGLGKMSKDSINTHIINQLDIPILVLGVSNLVVIASPDGVLVTDKVASVRLKEQIEELKSREM